MPKSSPSSASSAPRPARAATRLLGLALLAGLVAIPLGGCRSREAPAPSPARKHAPDPAGLFAAADHGDVEAARRALDAGTPVDVRDDHGDGSTALIRAARAGHRPVLDLLVSRHADPNGRDFGGRTALVSAILAGPAGVVDPLLAAGARPGDELPPWTPLRLAAFLGRAPAVEALLQKGADAGAADLRGMTALMYAAGRGHEDVVRALVKAGAPVSARDHGGHTALMFAADAGHATVVSALLEAGADAKVKNRAGATASTLADGNGHADVVALLAGRPAAAAPPRASAGRASDVAPAAARTRDDAAVFGPAARSAWAYVEANYRPQTGLIDATQEWEHATLWDVGSMLAALYCGRELGFLDEAAYRERMKKALATMQAMPLHANITFDRQYATSRVAKDGTHGWSPTDLGRVLLWLKIVATRDPALAPAAEAVVKRSDFGPVLRDGYLWGRETKGGASRDFQEGRIGYEQYAAAGFAAWKLPVAHAARFSAQGVPIPVSGQTLLADLRGDDRLTSDPVVLLGLEAGWTPEARTLAEGLLRAQEERWRRTGRITIVSEDALPRPPYFFYYYCVYTTGKEFAVDVQNPKAVVEGPRWISAKAAFAWHALLPSDYTRRAVEALAAARSSSGWSAGVYEGSLRSTGGPSINTQAAVLEAAVYSRTGRPMLSPDGGGAREDHGTPGSP